MKHTPGPWYVSLNPYRVGQRLHGVFRLVAECPTQTGLTAEGAAHKALHSSFAVQEDEARANAALIAEAPAMLEALKRVANVADTAASLLHRSIPEEAKRFKADAKLCRDIINRLEGLK
jgi:class 3 adenylate cyclase